jgi:three-Cys-motif partner protein
VPTPTTELWARDPHTAAKHQMLRAYLEAWFPIIAAGFGDAGLTYVDAFAGPGEYTEGEAGSPLIALAQARRPNVCGYGHPIRLVFIEERQDRWAHLSAVIESRFPVSSRPSNWRLRILHGRCQDRLIPALGELGASNAPIFVNFDGWGVDTPLNLVRHVGRYKTPEVLITFQTQFFLRFATQNIPAGDRVFGSSDWRELAASGTPDEKRSRLLHLYRAKLNEAHFDYSLVFEMLDEGGHDLLLIYGTRSVRGLEKMKDAMWSVDRVYGQRFRDPRDLDQLSFEINDEPDLTLLKRQLLVCLEVGETNLEALKDFALHETIFKGAHVPTAVIQLEAARKVVCTHARRHEDFMVRLAPPTLF